MKKIITAILSLSISGTVWAASYTITIPDNIFTDVINAIAYQHGYKDVVSDLDNPGDSIPNPESKLTFTKRMNRRWIRLNVEAWETSQSIKSAREQAILNAKTKTETIRVQ